MKKILFYIEPFPVRNHPSAFSWVFRLFCDFVRNDLIGAKHLQNAGLTARVLAPAYDDPTLKDFPGLFGAGKIMVPQQGSALDRLRVKYADLSWIPYGFSVWKDLIRGEGEVTDDYFHALVELHAEDPFDILFYWGNNGAVRKFAEMFSLPAIALELGCMRRPFFDSFYCDFQGVNGYSSLSGISLPQPPISYRMPSLSDNFGRGWDQLLWPPTVERSDVPTILVPLQLMDDSNIGVFSHFSSMSEFLLQVYEDLKPLGARLVVKPHPGAKNYAWTQRDQADCERLCAKLSNSIWLQNFDNNVSYLSLLNMVSGVAVVNGSTGFEASMFAKPVLSYGAGAYDGICYRTPEDFIEAVRDPSSHDTVSWRNRALMLLYHYLCDDRTVRDSRRLITQMSRQIELCSALQRGEDDFIAVLFSSFSFLEGSNSNMGSRLAI